ncbi:MAG TPA: hypothetical protein VNK49_01960 [Anaerolineales bacterium]|nr:hypothetical protein [Anaerolineales bacterium]
MPCRVHLLKQLATHVMEAVQWTWTYPDTAAPQTAIGTALRER